MMRHEPDLLPVANLPCIFAKYVDTGVRSNVSRVASESVVSIARRSMILSVRNMVDVEDLKRSDLSVLVSGLGVYRQVHQDQLVRKFVEISWISMSNSSDDQDES